MPDLNTAATAKLGLAAAPFGPIAALAPTARQVIPQLQQVPEPSFNINDLVQKQPRFAQSDKSDINTMLNQQPETQFLAPQVKPKTTPPPSPTPAPV